MIYLCILPLAPICYHKYKQYFVISVRHTNNDLVLSSINKSQISIVTNALFPTALYHSSVMSKTTSPPLCLPFLIAAIFNKIQKTRTKFILLYLLHCCDKAPNIWVSTSIARANISQKKNRIRSTKSKCKTRQVVFCHHIIIYWSFAAAHLRTWIRDHSLLLYSLFLFFIFYFGAGVQNKIYCHRIPWFFLISLCPYYFAFIFYYYYFLLSTASAVALHGICMVMVRSLRHTHTKPADHRAFIAHTNESQCRFASVCARAVLLLPFHKNHKWLHASDEKPSRKKKNVEYGNIWS